MKRAVTALVATVAGVVWLVTFKVTPHTRAVASAPPASALPDTPAPSPSATAATSPPSPTPTPAIRVANGTFTGATVPTRFGDVQVRITVSGGKVTDVSGVQMPFDRARSAEITQYVGPILRSEAIRAQNADIDVISGATFTSEAYAESLQDALRQDHLA
ncbi:MAG TPA: FMN-binding protein [Candidatus Dormibacteraeota bacterium]|nr:FMN-binding protein [Candidatus Dormibacteraeota bacterium]